MNESLENKNGFVSLIGMLLAVGIMVILCHFLMNAYFGGSNVEKQSGTSVSQGVGISSYPSTYQKMKNQVEDIEKQLQDREDNIFKNLPR